MARLSLKIRLYISIVYFLSNFKFLSQENEVFFNWVLDGILNRLQ